MLGENFRQTPGVEREQPREPQQRREGAYAQAPRCSADDVTGRVAAAGRPAELRRRGMRRPCAAPWTALLLGRRAARPPSAVPRLSRPVPVHPLTNSRAASRYFLAESVASRKRIVSSTCSGRWASPGRPRAVPDLGFARGLSIPPRAVAQPRTPGEGRAPRVMADPRGSEAQQVCLPGAHAPVRLPATTQVPIFREASPPGAAHQYRLPRSRPLRG